VASSLRLLGRKALSCTGEGVAGSLWPVPRQRVQGTICGGSGSAERMRMVPRPRQVGHWEGMDLLGAWMLTGPHVVVLAALSSRASWYPPPGGARCAGLPAWLVC
jgi:hypothetical protein